MQLLLLLLLALFSTPRPAVAHQLDLAYLDFGVSTSTGALTLTAALHSHQAFELVRTNPKTPYTLTLLQERGDAIAAYVQDHVEVRRGDDVCAWDPDSAVTPRSEFQALIDGITVAGSLSCPGDGPLTVESSLFLEKFPTQLVTVRLESPNGYADQFTLDRTARIGQLDISPLFPIITPTSTTAAVAPTSSSIPYILFVGTLAIVVFLGRRPGRAADVV